MFFAVPMSGTAVAVVHPANFRQIDAAVLLVNLEALRIPEAVAVSLFLETREASRVAFIEGIPNRAIKISKRLLQRL